jgi:hypothetical protein
MPRYPLCYNLICNKLQAQGHQLRGQTRSDLRWIMTTMDLDGGCCAPHFIRLSLAWATPVPLQADASLPLCVDKSRRPSSASARSANSS